MHNSHTRTHFIGNLLGLLGITGVLAIAFYEQFFQNQLPCPLCLLQRAAFTGVGIGFILNLCLSCRPAHYGLIILASLNGLIIAIRQIALHIAPTDPGYGLPFLGIHLYTWAALIFITIIGYTGLVLLFDKGFHKLKHNVYSKLVISLFLFVITIDCASSFLQCGLTGCPDNPIHYKLLS